MLKEKIIDGYKFTQTSYRTWEVISPDGEIYYIWADNKQGILRCSCRYYTLIERPRFCKHIKMILREFSEVNNG